MIALHSPCHIQPDHRLTAGLRIVAVHGTVHRKQQYKEQQRNHRIGNHLSSYEPTLLFLSVFKAGLGAPVGAAPLCPPQTTAEASIEITHRFALALSLIADFPFAVGMILIYDELPGIILVKPISLRLGIILQEVEMQILVMDPPLSAKIPEIVQSLGDIGINTPVRCAAARTVNSSIVIDSLAMVASGTDDRSPLSLQSVFYTFIILLLYYFFSFFATAIIEG